MSGEGLSADSRSGNPHGHLASPSPNRSPAMLESRDIPLSESALLVIDAQDSFKATSRWEQRNNVQFEENVSLLIDAYRSVQRPIFYFLHTDPDFGFARDSEWYRLMDFLAPRPEEPLIHKDTRNCFTATNLMPQLIASRSRRVAITGIQMEQCCETTARVAADLGLAVDFVLDGTMTFPIQHPTRTGESLGVDAIEERTVYALGRRFARITSAGELAGELRALK